VFAGHLHLVCQVKGIVDPESAYHVDVHHRDLLRGNRFDIHSALRREHHDRTARVSLCIDDDPGVVFTVDVQLFLDQHLLHQVTLDRGTDQLARHFYRLRRRIGKFDAARLSAASGPYLNLDHDGFPDFLRNLSGLCRRFGDIPLGNRHFGNLEQCLTLMLIQSSHTYLLKTSMISFFHPGFHFISSDDALPYPLFQFCSRPR